MPGASSLLRRHGLELVAAGARLGAAGLILPGEGNLSVLAHDDRETTVLITPTGVDKARLSPAELIGISWDDDARGSWPRLDLPDGASTETRMHLAIYAELSGARAVVHAHPPQTLALAGAGLLPDCAVLEEGTQLLGAVSWVPSVDPGSLRLAQDVATALLDAPACVLERHGAVTLGRTLEEALRRMLLLERLAGLTRGSV